MIECRTCGIAKGATDYYYPRGKRHPHCKSCQSTKQLVSWGKVSKAEQQRRNRNGKLKRLYGMTIEDYDAMLALQDGVCYICKSDKKLVVDHCHNSKVVRKILCYSCNVALGHAKDNPDTLIRMAEYIKEHGNL